MAVVFTELCCRLQQGLLCAVQLMKNETLKITYSFWDGQGHRRVATVKKGDTVKDFLQKVKEQLIPEFRELRCALFAMSPL